VAGKTKVLIVDDDTRILDILRLSLEKDGFEVFASTSGPAALKLAYKAHPDAIILDIMMPGMDGFEVCRRLRDMTDAAILFVTARGQAEDIVKGLQVGGDDYIIKPYAYQVLLARLTACLRRRASDKPFPVLKASGEVLWITDPSRRQIFVDDRVIQLTPKEFDIFRYMVKNQGRVLSTDAILANVWGPEYTGEWHLVKQFIYRLRKKLEPDPSTPCHIVTVHGTGYVFESET
jgi:DNA-binding response OmpR family regulator